MGARPVTIYTQGSVLKAHYFIFPFISCQKIALYPDPEAYNQDFFAKQLQGGVTTYEIAKKKE